MEVKGSRQTGPGANCTQFQGLTFGLIGGFTNDWSTFIVDCTQLQGLTSTLTPGLTNDRSAFIVDNDLLIVVNA